MSTRIANKLFKAYYDPSHPGSLGGVQRLAKATKIPVRLVKEWLKKQTGYQLHKPVRKTFPRSRVIVRGIDEQWAADLVDVQKLAPYNRGNKYILTVIDVFSKFGFAVPVKNKTGVAITEAFDGIFKSSKRIPLKLQTDKGKEFLNTTFQNFLKKENVTHFVTQSETKAQIVERFNRTLKDRMYRAFTVGNTLNYLSILDKLVKGYNASPHRTIGIPPEKVNLRNQEQIWKRAFRDDWLKNKGNRSRKKSHKLKVGQKVRISEAIRTFKKSYLPGWTEEVFVIERLLKKKPPVYKLTEYDGTPIKGTFYEEELQLVNVEDSDLFRIENVLKTRGRGNNKESFVEWKGWPSKYNSWIKSNQIKPLTKSAGRKSSTPSRKRKRV